MLHPNFVFLGVALQFFGGLSYFIDTIKGKIQPNKVSWLVWSIAPLVAFAAEISQGVGLQSLTTFTIGFVPLLIFIASFVNKKAYWQLGKLDLTCGGLSLLGLSLWYVTKVGNIAIFFAILADALAAIPTIIKSYHHPESENHWVYSLGVINVALGLLVIDAWNFTHYAFPAYIFIADSIIFLLIKFKLGRVLAKKR